MAARKKVKASARKKQQQPSNMPPEMRAAMTGAPQTPVTAQTQTSSAGWMQALTRAPSATDNGVMEKRFYLEMARLDSSGNEILDDDKNPIDPIIFDKVACWKPETPRQRDGYIQDLGTGRFNSACTKAVFLRLLNKDGSRVFTNEQQFEHLCSNGLIEAIEMIGAHILNIQSDDSEVSAPETTVASEKEE